jgi:hypothetical protein
MALKALSKQQLESKPLVGLTEQAPGFYESGAC